MLLPWNNVSCLQAQSVIDLRSCQYATTPLQKLPGQYLLDKTFHTCSGFSSRMGDGAGQPFWKAAGVADKVKLHIGPARETLQDLLAVSP